MSDINFGIEQRAQMVLMSVRSVSAASCLSSSLVWLLLIMLFSAGPARATEGGVTTDTVFVAVVEIGDARTMISLRRDRKEWHLSFVKVPLGVSGGHPRTMRALLSAENALFLLTEVHRLISLPADLEADCPRNNIRLVAAGEKSWHACLFDDDIASREVRMWMKLVAFVFK